MDLFRILPHVAALAGAYALAFPIGWNREREARSAGLRTFPLVAAASAAYVLVGGALPGAGAESQSRIVQGLMTGIGFIGGGAILKSRGHVRGTATAASVWMTGALGAAAGHGLWAVAVLVSALTTVALQWLTRVERRMKGDPPDADGGRSSATPARAELAADEDGW